MLLVLAQWDVHNYTSQVSPRQQSDVFTVGGYEWCAQCQTPPLVSQHEVINHRAAVSLGSEPCQLCAGICCSSGTAAGRAAG